MRLLFLLALPFFVFADSFILITSLYNEVNPERQQEYLECLTKNLSHPDIEHIHVFYDTSKDAEGDLDILSFLKSQPVSLTLIHERPTFRRIFSFVNKEYPNRKVMIANADIFFDDTLHPLCSWNLQNLFLALTRWNILANGELEGHPFYYGGRPVTCSQDTWIFQTPIKVFDVKGIGIGTLHCDGYIAYRAAGARYKVFNPCLSIVTHHFHVSCVRHWLDVKANEPQLELPWCTLENPVYTTFRKRGRR